MCAGGETHRHMSYVKDIPMKARKNPTNEQLLRRLRRPLDSDRDPRIKNDAYYALRHQGHPHASAIRAFRDQPPVIHQRSEEHTSELQSLMRISYAVFCLKKKKTYNNNQVTS